MTVISGNKSFNATAALDKLKDTALGALSLSQIYICNRAFIDTFDGERIQRNEFNPNDGQEGHYACDYKL